MLSFDSSRLVCSRPWEWPRCSCPLLSHMRHIARRPPILNGWKTGGSTSRKETRLPLGHTQSLRRPKDTVAFLKKNMKPLTISSAQVKALLLKLGNDNESVWKPAFEELEYFDPRLAIDLQTLMDRYTERRPASEWSRS